MRAAPLVLAGVLQPIDWALIVLYFAVAFGLALAFMRRASKSTSEFFTSGKAAPWWLAGISMVATTFAADTPLAVTGIVALSGVVGNWVWWSLAMSVMATVFIYAKLWRRLGVMTDVEFTEVRYSGPPAAFLRGFRALYLGLMLNGLILGWVTVGMRKVVAVFLEMDSSKGGVLLERVTGLTSWLLAPLLGVEASAWGPEEAAWGIILFLYLITAVSVLLSGLWGVMVVDAFQFAIAIGMAITLAVIAMNAVGGADSLRESLNARLAADESHLTADDYMNILPRFAPPPEYSSAQLAALGWDDQPSWLKTQLTTPALPPAQAAVTPDYAQPPAQTGVGSQLLLTFLVWIGMQWWCVWYPGHEPGGGGYIAQRILSAKNEQHSLYATLLFSICHFALRPWPWVIVGLVALVQYAHIPMVEEDPEKGYAWAMFDLLSPGMLGLMLVSFLAAFMSTISTQINWGSSYVVNDFYQRFFAKTASQRHLVWASRVATVLLMLVGIIVSARFDSVKGAWEFVIGIGAGTGLVLMLRWFWWRINAWSEITAMLASFALWGGLLWLNRSILPTLFGWQLNFAAMLLITISITTALWIAVTMATRPTSMERLTEFYRRALPPGPGWGPVAAKTADARPLQTLRLDIVSALLGCVMIYGGLFGLGKLLLGEPRLGAILLGVAAVATLAIILVQRARGFQAFAK